MNLLCTIISGLIGITIFPPIYRITPVDVFDGVVFYRGLLAVVLTFILHLILMLWAKRKWGAFSSTSDLSLNSLSLASIVLCFNTTFLIVFPVTVDRSVTTFLLEAIERNPGLSVTQLEGRLIDDYITRRQAVNRRIQEQLTTGNVTIENGGITLSERGRRFMKFSRLLRVVFELPDRSVPDGLVPDRLVIAK